MTETVLTPAPQRHTTPLGPLRRALRGAAVVSCVPYIALKITWIAGGRIGIPDDSVLLDRPGVSAAVNSVSVVMDAMVVVLALLLTQDWGRRLPARLIALPMWVATGLLTPIMTGYPLQLLARAFTDRQSRPADSEPFLDGWVFAVVYTGFIIQGLALGTLFALYARDRWGHLWAGAVRDLPDRAAAGPLLRVTAVTGAVLAALSGVPHLMWAAGSTVGLSPSRADGRGTDFHVLEGTFFLLAALTVAAVLMLALRRGGRLPVRAPLAVAWLGSGALGCWGGWLLAASVAPSGSGTDQPSVLMVLTYAVQMTAGLLLLVAGTSFLRRLGGGGHAA